MNRITKQQLLDLVARLNSIVGAVPGATGSYRLNLAYGGTQLVRIVSDSGSILPVVADAYLPRRECYGLISAYIAGIIAAQNIGLE